MVTTLGGFNQSLQGVAILTGMHPAMMASSLQPLAFDQLEGLRCRASCGHRTSANVSTRACKVFGGFTQSLQWCRAADRPAAIDLWRKLQPDVQVVRSRGGLGPSALGIGFSQSLQGAGLPYSPQPWTFGECFNQSW